MCWLSYWICGLLIISVRTHSLQSQYSQLRSCLTLGYVLNGLITLFLCVLIALGSESFELSHHPSTSLLWQCWVLQRPLFDKCCWNQGHHAKMQTFCHGNNIPSCTCHAWWQCLPLPALLYVELLDQECNFLFFLLVHLDKLAAALVAATSVNILVPLFVTPWPTIGCWWSFHQDLLYALLSDTNHKLNTFSRL